MTYAEALAEARRRWGPHGTARANIDGRKFVGTIGAPIEARAFGTGATWEEAFASSLADSELAVSWVAVVPRSNGE